MPLFTFIRDLHIMLLPQKEVLLCVILVAGLPYTSCIKIATKINVIEGVVIDTKNI